jgi:hypothetical protein
MGLFGSAIAGSLGSLTGQKAGNFIGRKTHNKLAGKISGGVLSATGKVLGTVGGAMLPFSHGGKVMAPKGKPVPALIHGDEYVLPVNAKPTKAQIAIVAKNKRDARKK